VDLEILDLDVLCEIFGKNFDNGLFVRVEPDVGIVTADFFTSQDDIFALGEIRLEMMSVSSDVMELNQSSLLFVKSMHLEVVLVKDDVVDSRIVPENVRVDFLQKNLLA
jgi:hypothetical protein